MPPKTIKTNLENAIIPRKANSQLKDSFILEVMSLFKRIEEKTESKKQILSEGNFFNIFNNIFFKLSFYD